MHGQTHYVKSHRIELPCSHDQDNYTLLFRGFCLKYALISLNSNSNPMEIMYLKSKVRHFGRDQQNKRLFQFPRRKTLKIEINCSIYVFSNFRKFAGVMVYNQFIVHYLCKFYSTVCLLIKLKIYNTSLETYNTNMNKRKHILFYTRGPQALTVT